MHVQQVSVQGEDFIGLLGMATDRYAILSTRFPRIDALGVPMIKTTLYGTNLVGIFCAGNSSGLLLPYFVSEKEVASLRKALSENGVDARIGLMRDKSTALGNLVACNDKAALASPLLEDVRTMQDTLGVEVVQRQVGGHDEAGACCVATNRGFIAHPDAEQELLELGAVLKVEGMVGSVNFGFPFIKSGLIANSHGYVAGGRTSGIELTRIDDAFHFYE